MTPETLIIGQRPGFADRSRTAEAAILSEANTRARFARMRDQEDIR